MKEPLTNITNPRGKVCMWGEHIDGSDLEQTIWPRAAAAAGIYLFICYYQSHDTPTQLGQDFDDDDDYQSHDKSSRGLLTPYML